MTAASTSKVLPRSWALPALLWAAACADGSVGPQNEDLDPKNIAGDDIVDVDDGTRIVRHSPRVQHFGTAVAANAHHVVIGSAAPFGAPGGIYVYGDSPNGWTFEGMVLDRMARGAVQDLVMQDGWMFARYAGDTTDWTDEDASLAVFHREGVMGWSLVDVLPDGNVAMHGDRVMVGHPADFPYEMDGSVQIYQLGESGMKLETALAADGRPCDRIHPAFGVSVALSGDLALVGEAPAEGRAAYGQAHGFVHVYVNDDGEWTEIERLYEPMGTGDPWFGRALAASGDTVVVGADGGAWIYLWDGQELRMEARVPGDGPFALDDTGHRLVYGRHLWSRTEDAWTPWTAEWTRDASFDVPDPSAVAIDRDEVAFTDEEHDAVWVFTL